MPVVNSKGDITMNLVNPQHLESAEDLGGGECLLTLTRSDLRVRLALSTVAMLFGAATKE